MKSNVLFMISPKLNNCQVKNNLNRGLKYLYTYNYLYIIIFYISTMFLKTSFHLKAVCEEFNFSLNKICKLFR